MVIQPLGLKIEKKHHVSATHHIIAVLSALALALLVTALLIYLAGVDIFVALQALLSGSFGGWRTFAETLVRATPLILTGLAITIAFQAKVWNIGAEGQIFAGGIAAYWVINQFQALPGYMIISLAILAAMLSGGLWALIPGVLKVRFGANEIVVTVMMNYIILYLLSYLLSGSWQDPNSAYLQTSRIPEAAQYPILFSGARLHIGLLLALFTAVFAFIFLWRTPLGYEIRAIGHNAKAAIFKGINLGRTIILTMFISGAIAGLAGVGELAGIHHRLRMDISTGYGFVGIIIALIARLHPITVILVAILFGGLESGAIRMQIHTKIPVALVQAIQGIILLFVITADVLSRYRLRRIKEC